MSRFASCAAAALLLSAAHAVSATTKLVVCAPGYPGSTVEAQPSLDQFALVAAKAAGWSEGSLTAVYYPIEDDGLAALAGPDAAVALVAWPFFDEHGDALRLTPIAQAAFKTTGGDEVWSLVTKKGRVQSPAQLAGWEIVSLAGYAPDFVRGRALAGWGKLPGDTRITAGHQVLSALRRAASGDNVAVLLDGAQTTGLTSLPFAADLEIVATSPRMPVAVLCAVGTRIPATRARAFARALEHLHESPAGAAALEGLRLARFVPTTLDAPSPTPKAGATRK